MSVSDSRTDRLTELRRLAGEATPGPWRWADDDERIEALDGTTIVYAIELDGPDATYLAAASPSVILSLLDELEAFRANADAQAAYGSWRGDAETRARLRDEAYAAAGRLEALRAVR